MRTLVWFRGKDLRLADHPPLTEACAAGEVVPLFVVDPYFFAPERARAAPHRIQFLLESLQELERSIRGRGSRLVVARGRSVDVLPRLARRFAVDRVVAHRWVEPFARERDRRVAERLHVPFDLFEGATLCAPEAVRTKAGTPFAVFGAYQRAFGAAVRVDEPLPAPRRLPALPAGIRATASRLPSLAALGLRRNPRLLRGGERAAAGRLRRFLRGPARRYDQDRDRLDRDGTSRLSADLKFGTLSPRQVWAAARKALGPRSAAWAKFRAELLWREFAHATLWHRPEVLERPFKAEFEGFPWRWDAALWKAWTDGRTGYPVVDASARQLLAEGFVPNRARMISASFLAKDLMLEPALGEAHYLAWLTDGDWASNNLGWQWAAGTGCDAQPWFRVFNPVLQGRRFDPDGAYVKRWLPELRGLPARRVHAPWTASAAALEAAGLRLGVDYPERVVDHAERRARYLATARAHLRQRRPDPGRPRAPR